MKQLLIRCINLALVALWCAIGASCTDTETTDSTAFTLYYSGLTDIGPSMEGIVSSPTYKGATPSEFSLTGVTLNGEMYTGAGFSIHPDNGSIAVSNTHEMAVGLYRLSVACMAGGKLHEFKGAAEVNLLAPVPDGIQVEPSVLQVEYADIDAASSVVLPTAQVTTEGTHVSISKYALAASAYSEFFAISNTGEISIAKGNTEILPGVYVLSLKLTTPAGEGIFEDALTVKVTSKPLGLSYTPATGKVEEESDGPTSLTSAVPYFKGSTDELVYSIASVVPANSAIGIDPATGAIQVHEGHGLKAGETYSVSVRAANAYAPEGVLFAEVYTIEAVSFIEPIANLKYEDATRTQAVAFTLNHTPDLVGDEPQFELIDLEASLQGQLTIDQTGTIRAKRGNTIALGAHAVTVKAFNSKGAVTTTFTLTIAENQNFFTSIVYGNNLGLPVNEQAYQYRVHSADELAALAIPAPTTDIRPGVKVAWSVEALHQLKGTTINSDGVLSFTKGGWKDAQGGLIVVTATAGEGEEAVSVSVPVFFHFATAVAGVSVEYSPFVVRANPRVTTRSAAPKLVGLPEADKANFLIDYRRTFNYYDLGGKHISGTPAQNGFLSTLWESYFAQAGGTLNFSSKAPMSYYDNQNNLTLPLAYPDLNGEVVVNPNKWTDGEYAHGAFIGQMTFVTNGNSKDLGGSNNQIFPLFIYLY